MGEEVAQGPAWGQCGVEPRTAWLTDGGAEAAGRREEDRRLVGSPAPE